MEQKKDKTILEIIEEAIGELSSSERSDKETVALNYCIVFRKVLDNYEFETKEYINQTDKQLLSKLSNSMKVGTTYIDILFQIKDILPVNNYDELNALYEEFKQKLETVKSQIEDLERKFVVKHTEDGIKVNEKLITPETKDASDEEASLYLYYNDKDLYESQIKYLKKILIYLKRQTLISIEKSFSYLNVDKLETEHLRSKRWYRWTIGFASIFLILALCLVCWNVFSINDLTAINDEFWANFIPKVLASFTFFALTILSLNQASRMRKTMLVISKEITEFRYIEGLLKAKNEIDYNRDSNDKISAVIDQMISNHLAIQNGRINKEDQTIDSDISLENLKLLYSTLEQIINKKQ